MLNITRIEEASAITHSIKQSFNGTHNATQGSRLSKLTMSSWFFIQFTRLITDSNVIDRDDR